VLERGLAILERLVEHSPTSRRYRRDRGQCLVQVDDARIHLGLYQGAAICLREAGEGLGALVGEDPDAVDVRYWLAVAKRGLGEVALAQGRTAAARLLGEAIAIHEPIPLGSLHERDLLAFAWSYVWLGRAELQAGHPEANPALQRKLVQVLETFKSQSFTGLGYTGSSVPHWSRDFAQIEGLFESLLLTARAATPADRIAARRREVQVWESLAGRQPDNPAVRFEVAWSLVPLADSMEQAGQVAEARSSLDRALPVLNDLAKAEPENLRWRQGLARAWETLGRVQARFGRSAEARDAANQAVTIAEELARLDPAYAYDLACMLGLRSRVSASEADAAKAIAAVRRAIRAGFDNDYLLRTDPRLEGLRSRPDFPAARGRTT
jgi:tetratricopeptide (TPR) repeat protein